MSPYGVTPSLMRGNAAVRLGWARCEQRTLLVYLLAHLQNICHRHAMSESLGYIEICAFSQFEQCTCPHPFGCVTIESGVVFFSTTVEERSQAPSDTKQDGRYAHVMAVQVENDDPIQEGGVEATAMSSTA